MDNIIRLVEVSLTWTWPLAVLIICLVFFSKFKEDISTFFKNIRSVKTSGGDKAQMQITLNEAQSEGGKNSYGKDNPQKPSNLINGFIAFFAFVAIIFTWQSSIRTGKLFVGQNKPLIDVSPIGITQEANGQSKTSFSVVNYSGFVAYKIAIDVKYEESNKWISEWRKARNEKKEKGEKKEVVVGKFYPSTPEPLIPKLSPGKTKDRDVFGSLNLEKKLCDPNDPNRWSGGYPVFVRVSWQNKKGHVFDEIHKYKLVCTRDNEGSDPGSGRAFTFIPEGVISRKDESVIVIKELCQSESGAKQPAE
jgi:hypothetical protein